MFYENDYEQVVAELGEIKLEADAALAVFGLQLVATGRTPWNTCTTYHFEAGAGIDTVARLALDTALTIPEDPTKTKGVMNLLARVHMPGEDCKNKEFARFETTFGEVIIDEGNEDGEDGLGQRRLEVVKAMSSMTIARASYGHPIRVKEQDETTVDGYDGLRPGDSLADYGPITDFDMSSQSIPFTANTGLAQLYDVQGRLRAHLQVLQATGGLDKVYPQYRLK
jgi:hypothetical protein